VRVVVALAVASLFQASQAPTESLQHLGQPARGRSILAGRLIVDKASGAESLVLANNNETSGLELIVIDLEKNTAASYQAPSGAGAWAMQELPGDRLAVGTFYDGAILIFDLTTRSFTKSIKFPGESYIWQFALAGDGRLYGGTYPGGKLGAVNVNTYAIEDLGAPAAPNMYLRNVSTTPDGRVLCYFGMEQPASLLFDPKTKTFARAPEPLQKTAQGVVWNGYFLAGDAAYGSDLTRLAEHPFPIPPAKGGDWLVSTALTTPDVLYIHQGKSLWRFRKGDKDLSLVYSLNLHGGQPLAVMRDERIVGFRGQEYFVIEPGSSALDVRAIPGEDAPRAIQLLEVDERGHLWGSPPSAATLFRLQPDTRAVTHTGTVVDSAGAILDMVFVGGIMYAVAYSGGDIIRYDPGKPWDQWHENNPRTIASVADRGFIRPTGGVVAGPGGRLYSGWMAKYGVYGGAVASTDPRTGHTEIIENPLGEQEVAGLATDGTLLYVGSGLVANGLPNKRGEAPKLGILDPQTKKVVWHEAVAGATRVRPLAFDPKSSTVPVAVDAQIRLFDTKARVLAAARPATPPLGSSNAALGANGRLYYGSGQQVIELNLTSGASRTVGDAPAAVNNITTSRDRVYISAGIDVYALRIPND
jgi:streptogramin lyase